ncbi:MAG: MFS transporter [Sporichthyaceae bacterium]
MSLAQPLRPVAVPVGPGVRWIGLVMFVIMTAGTLPSPLYPVWSGEYGFGPLTVTVIFSVYVVGVMAGLLGLGHLSDAVGRRPVLLAALAMCAISDVLYLTAGGLPALLAARVFSGLATGLLTGTATAAMVELAPPGAKERAAGLAVITNTCGLASGTVLAGAFAQYLAYPTHLVYVLHLGVVAVAVMGPLLALGPGTRGAWAGVRLQKLGVPVEIRATFWRAAFAGGAGFAVMGVVNSLAAVFLAELVDVHNLLLVGLVVAPVFATVVFGQLGGRALPPAARLPLSCLVLAAAGGLTALSLNLAQALLFVIAGGLAGFGVGLAIGHGVATINADCPPARRGEANSTFFAVMYAGLSIPVIGAGFAVRQWGLQTGGELFSAAVAVVALAVGASLLVDHLRGRRMIACGRT